MFWKEYKRNDRSQLLLLQVLSLQWQLRSSVNNKVVAAISSTREEVIKQVCSWQGSQLCWAYAHGWMHMHRLHVQVEASRHTL